MNRALVAGPQGENVKGDLHPNTVKVEFQSQSTMGAMHIP